MLEHNQNALETLSRKHLHVSCQNPQLSLSYKRQASTTCSSRKKRFSGNWMKADKSKVKAMRTQLITLLMTKQQELQGVLPAAGAASSILMVQASEEFGIQNVVMVINLNSSPSLGEYRSILPLLALVLNKTNNHLLTRTTTDAGSWSRTAAVMGREKETKQLWLGANKRTKSSPQPPATGGLEATETDTDYQ